VLAGITGDTSARFVYGAQPVKFAAMEGLYATTRGAPLHLGGIPSNSEHRVLYAIEIPYGLSILAAFDPNAEVRGLDSFPYDVRPNPIVVHLSFDTMVGLGTGLGLLALVFWAMVFRSRRLPRNRLLLWCLVAGGPAAVVTMEAGWFVTEFGRQPWVVYGIIRTVAAATPAPGLGIVFIVFTAIYVALAVTLSRLLLLLARRNREHAQPALGTEG
jgi:cytochrome d ubiquinol oxidase subunit I